MRPPGAGFPRKLLFAWLRREERRAQGPDGWVGAGSCIPPVLGVLPLLDSEHPSWPPQSSGGLALLPAQLLVCGLSAAVQEGWGLGQERASGRGLLGKDRV